MTTPNAPPLTTTPVCYICDKPAACFGSYEGNANHAFSCDDCCGHGNEDGWCTSDFSDIGDWANQLVKESDVQDEEFVAVVADRDRLAQENAELRSQNADRLLDAAKRVTDAQDEVERLRADAACLSEAMGEAVEMLRRHKKPHSNGEAAAVLLERTLSSRDSAKWLAEELEEARKETRLECLQVDDREALSELLALRQAQRDYPRRFSDIGLAEHDAKVRSESAVRIATLEAILRRRGCEDAISGGDLGCRIETPIDLCETCAALAGGGA